MDIYQVNHQQLLKGIRCNFQRYLYKQIQWDDRLIGIFGSQGVGKTTLLLQRIKQAFDDSDKALYLNLDSILFQREKMVNVAMQFYKEGGTHLFLDSVHRYADWMTETRKLLDRCPNLNIVFASSSLITSRPSLSKSYPRSFGVRKIPLLKRISMEAFIISLLLWLSSCAVVAIK